MGLKSTPLIPQRLNKTYSTKESPTVAVYINKTEPNNITIAPPKKKIKEFLNTRTVSSESQNLKWFQIFR